MVNTNGVDSQLEDLINSLEASSLFCTSGSLAPVLPGLEVDGLGPLGMPIAPEQARLLAELGAPAPFGKGEETVYDSTVRHTLQLEPGRLSFRNSEWGTFIEGIVASVKKAFAIHEPMTCRLYKMLIYE